MTDSKNRKDAYLADAMAEVYRQWEILKTYDEFTDGKLQNQILGDNLASMQGATRSGTAKLHTENTPFKDNIKKWFGVDVDATMENEAYRYLDNVSTETNLPDWMKTSLLVMKDVYRSWDEDLLNALPSGELGGVKFGATQKTDAQTDSIMEKKIRSQYTLDALQKIYDPTTTSFKDVYLKQGFKEDEANFLAKETSRMLLSLDKKEGKTASIEKGNQKVEENMGVDYKYFQMGEGKTFQDQMENMRVNNPYLYNYTVGLV